MCEGNGTLDDDLGLEPRCGRCNGTGKFPNTVNVKCEVCKGTGRIPPVLRSDEEMITSIMDRMWEYPDEEVEVYSQADKPVPSYLLNAQMTRHVHLEHGLGWYEHPNFPRDYITIGPNPVREWERE